MSQYVYLAELVAFDPSTMATTTLRYSSGNGFVTGPAETPANTYYDGVLKQPAALSRALFADGKTSGRSKVGFGDLVLHNPNGNLDGLKDYGFSGRDVTIRRGLVGAAYPSGFTTLFSGTMEQPVFSRDEITIKLRDNQQDLLVPLQPVKYTGTNTLPSGVEGVAGDLLGKPKPVCYGTVQNVPAPCVNTSKLIFQVNDRAVTSIPAVYDQGIALAPGRIWSSRSHAFGADDILCLVHNGSSLFVAAGTTGTLETSADGAAWTARTSGIATQINALAFGGGVYVYGASLGSLRSSTDAITWTARVSGFGANAIQGMCYSTTLALFCAVGDGGTIATSPDGVTWMVRTSGTTNTLQAVTYASGLFVAVGYLGTVTTSSDGITWTVRTTAFSTVHLFALAYGNGMFVAAGEVGKGIATSPDGITWTLRSSVLTARVRAVAYGTSFLMTDESGHLASSADGVTWSTVASSPFGATFMHALLYDGTDYLGAGGNGAGRIYQTRTPQYASLADLQDDTQAPPAGTFIPFLAGGCFRLGSSPVGQVTADATEGATAGVRTRAQVFARILQERGGKGAGDWSASDVTADDTATAGAQVGLWVFEETTVADLLDQLVSPGAWWGLDRTGVYRLQSFTAPSGTAVLSLTANDLLEPLARVSPSDDSKGLPSYRTIVQYARNYTPQTTDLAAGVSDARKTFLARAWREARSEDTSVLNAHLQAAQTVEPSPLAEVADAQTEATRLQLLRSVLRHRFQLVLQLNDETQSLDLGDVVSLTHSRYGLSAGVLFRIVALATDYQRNRLTVTVWGPSDPVSRMAVRPFTMAGTGAVTTSGLRVRVYLYGVGTVT